MRIHKVQCHNINISILFGIYTILKIFQFSDNIGGCTFLYIVLLLNTCLEQHGMRRMVKCKKMCLYTRLNCLLPCWPDTSLKRTQILFLADWKHDSSLWQLHHLERDVGSWTFKREEQKVQGVQLNHVFSKIELKVFYQSADQTNCNCVIIMYKLC